MRDAARFAAVTGLAMVASLLCALLIKGLAGLQGDLSVLAVAVALSTGRVLRRRQPRARLLAIALLPVTAVIASLVAGRMLHQAVLGDTLFTVGIAAGIWLRRFGTRAASAGAVLTVPLVALLVVPAPVGGGDGASHDAWSALVAAQAGLWALLALTVAERTGFLAVTLTPTASIRARFHAEGGESHRSGDFLPPRTVERPAMPGAPTPATTPRAPVPSATLRAPAITPRPPVPPATLRAPTPAITSRAPTPSRLPASTRMAVQMGLGLGAAFLIGHQLWPTHWTWVVISAYVVASGNRGRADVLHKFGLRVLGAAVGTVLATLLIGILPTGDDLAIVLIMVTLVLGTLLRERGYAYWAASVTAVVALLNGYYGERSSSLLGTRLEGIVCGGLIATVIALTVLPVRTTDVLRRRVADALAALTDYLTAARRRDLATITEQHARLTHALGRLEEISPPLLLSHRLGRWLGRTNEHHVAHALLALRACGQSLAFITTRVTARPELLSEEAFAQALADFQGAVVKTRRAMAGSPLPVAGIVALADQIEALAASTDHLHDRIIQSNLV